MDKKQNGLHGAYKFYQCSLGQPGEGYDEENLVRCAKYSAHFMHKDTTQRGVFNEIEPPAIALLRYKNEYYVAYGEVVRAWKDENNDELEGWTYRIDVKEWIWYDPDNHERGVSGYGVDNQVIGGGIRATIKQIKPEWGLDRINEIDKNSDLAKKLNSLNVTNKEMETCIELLKSNKNLILTGAPGTGKTYLAKQMAKQMIGTDDLKDNEQYGFVQFHPSYDYTDFVEGLRPTKLDEKGNIGFERQDGVFKSFCARASKELRIDVTDNFDEAWKNLLATIAEKGQIEVPLLSGNRDMEIRLNEEGDGIIEYQEGKNIDSNSLFTFDKLYNIYRGGKGTPSGAHDTYRRAVTKEMRRNYGLKEYNPGKIKKYDAEKDKPFIMIIDEINRGDISKIFGELFFSIDPGYRGKDGRVQTQYQNMIDKDGNDEFKDGFYVPENVYIIGTMNDIDRSVESMDFAMRRRFAWKEIKAKDTQNMLDDLCDDEKMKGKYKYKMDSNGIQAAKNRMDNLNAKISDENGIGLNSAYHIGASYFMKLANYSGDDKGRFDKLWKNHLEGVLREYLRGDESAEGKISELYKAFNNENLTGANGAASNGTGNANVNVPSTPTPSNPQP